MNNIENKKMIYQTDKFIIKCDVKGKRWYVILMNKETEKNFNKSSCKAKELLKRNSGKILGWDNKKLNKFKTV